MRAASEFYHADAARSYFQCCDCRLVFVDPARWITREEAKRHYGNHQNDPLDQRYRRFLNRLFEPLSHRLTTASSGLDYGSGPGPTLSLMFAEAGHAMQIYDPIYAPDRSVLGSQYDFITVSEVVEHFQNPAEEFALLWSLLKVGGWLGIMTKRVRDVAAFRTWHYKSDPTHVSFFSLETFAWLSSSLAATWTVEGADVVLFQRTSLQELPDSIYGLTDPRIAVVDNR